MAGYGAALLDEICLEGAAGATVATLWRSIEHRFGHEPPEALKRAMWRCVLTYDCLSFYELSSPRTPPPLRSRFVRFDDRTWDLAPDADEPPPRLDADYGRESRTDVTAAVKSYSFERACGELEHTLVIVGDQRSRWNSLAPGVSEAVLAKLSTLQYCVLERIGRSRYNGETTSGDHSLVASLKEHDPKTMSYLWKSLVKYQLVVKQTIPVTLNRKFIQSSHLSLPRFYRKYADTLSKGLKLVERYLQGKNVCTLRELRLFVCKFLHKRMYHQMKTSGELDKMIDFKQDVLYREVYPNAPEDKWKNSSTGNEKLLTTVTLKKNYERKPNNASSNDISCNEKDYIVGEASVIGESMLRQTYICILNSGTKGISHIELAKVVGCSASHARLLCRSLMRTGVLCTITEEVNRMKVIRFFSQVHKKAVSEEFFKAKKKLKSILNKEENPSLDCSESILDQVDICDLKKNTGAYKSLRQMKRINIIMEKLSEDNIITNFGKLAKYISSKEDNTGIIDHRSLSSILTILDRQKKLNFLRLKITGKFSYFQLKILCATHIDINHPKIQAFIEKTKSQLQIRNYARHFGTLKKQKLQYIPCIAKSYGSLPRFSKMHALHSFLFQLIYGPKNVSCDLPMELKSLIQNEDLNESEFTTYYDAVNEDYTFTSPLPPASEYPTGWIVLSDLINRLPLSMLVKLININYNVPELHDYLKHPVKSKFILKNTPDIMQAALLYRRKYIASLFNTITLLCYFGLVQLGKQETNEKDSIAVYVNRNAIVWDTTSSKPGYYFIEEKQYPYESFRFDSMKDLESYWERLKSICLNTRLGERNLAIGKLVETQSIDSKLKYALEENTFDDATKRDNGYIPGDGKGAAGLDSLLFSHMKKQWTRDVQNIKPIKRKTFIAKQPNVNASRKRPLLSRGQMHKHQPTPKRHYIRKILPRKKTVVERPSYHDSIDAKIVQSLGKRRTRWTAFENKVLVACKIAASVACPCATFVVLTTIRDALRTCLGSLDKTSLACKRRLCHLSSNPRTATLIENEIDEIKKDPTLSKTYYNLHFRLKIANCKENLEKFKIHFLEFVSIIFHRLYKQILTFNKVNLLSGIDAFLSKYSPVQRDDGKFSIVNEIWGGVLDALIHSVLGCGAFNDKKYYPMLNVYKKYPENLLRPILANLRISGMVSLGTVKTDTAHRKELKLSNQYFYGFVSVYSFKIFSQAIVYASNLVDGDEECPNLPKVLNGGMVALLLDLLSVGCFDIDLNMSEHFQATEGANDAAEIDEVFSNNAESSISRFSLGSGQIVENNDMILINDCNLTPVFKSSLQDIQKISNIDMETFIKHVLSDGVYEGQIQELNVDENEVIKTIVSYISSKNSRGVASAELMNFVSSLGLSAFELKNILTELRERKIIWRLGCDVTKWVTAVHLKDWSVKTVTGKEIAAGDVSQNRSESEHITEIDTSMNEVDDEPAKKKRRISDEEPPAKQTDVPPQENEEIDEMQYLEMSPADENATPDDIADASIKSILPRPWIKPDGSINCPLLWRWIGSVLNYLLTNPMCKLSRLEARFKYMPPHHLRSLIEMMSMIGCVETVVIGRNRCTLWNDSVYHTGVATGLEDSEELFVEIVEGAFLKYTLFRRNHLTQEESIKC